MNKEELKKLKEEISKFNPQSINIANFALLEILEIIENQEQDINKLINYIAIKEDLDFKQAVEKFELGDYK